MCTASTYVFSCFCSEIRQEWLVVPHFDLGLGVLVFLSEKACEVLIALGELSSVFCCPHLVAFRTLLRIAY